MSAKNTSDFTKIVEDDNIDSGIVSGPLDLYSGEVESEPETESVEKKVLCDSAEQADSELDSGILCHVTESLSNVQLSDSTSVEPKFVCRLSPPSQTDLPPLEIFFQQDSDGDTQLHIATVHGCKKSVGTLIRVCPNKALLDVANDDGHTPLHLAVMGGNAVVTRMLVHAGLSLGARDRTGETPLHKATAKGHIECLQALLAPVPENPPRKLASVLNQKNYNGQACVHLAASAGHQEALQTLVYYGADINAVENLAGWTALHIAARRGDARLAAWLAARCAGVQARARDYAGRTPRRLARRTPAARAFANLSDDSDSDSDDDDDMYDSDSESLFERLRESMSPANVKGCC
ncbi:NF-kappa-B inhibitor cactus-like [Trichoplusia ni]|uniref:NF-kappa-B inhibitor cactus-like n=1 Tax=Trichoplusia ni TaxID=7111 RepID=A0A7E5VXW1_TRINI|nr:NF-kappa-B inhibitor cactus-like [Trichoplusia ni]